MKGKYEIELYNNKVHYRLTVKRNITILQGDSASGKSEMIRLLTAYNNSRESSGITLICQKICTVLTEEDWEMKLAGYRDRIIFIDEGNGFLRSKQFAAHVKRSDNYFVIIYRDSLYGLPYSIEEIYGLRESRDSQKYRNPKRVYNEQFQLYTMSPGTEINPDQVVVEDSNSGYEFFHHVFGEKCISANGKSNVKHHLLNQSGKKSILAIVDGAAFGPEMQACMAIIRALGEKGSIFAPESFEYLILQSNIVDVEQDVLAHTYDHADSARYFSWEEFYTWYLTERSRGTVYQYLKRKLPQSYLTEGAVNKLKSVIPDRIIAPGKDHAAQPAKE